MKTHYKKLTQPYFDLVRLGIKTFELRKNDCDYQNGDILVLQEYDPKTKINPYGIIKAQIRCVLSDFEGLEKGYVILGIEVLEK